MGLVTNYPLALASGMGLNAVVAFQLVAGMKLPWTAAMGVVLLEGLVITALVLTGFREAIMNAIPAALKRAIGVGIGLFILFIGLVSAGIVKPGPPGVPAGVLRRRRVAAPDVATVRTPPEVEPPAARRQALDAARAARRDRGINP